MEDAFRALAILGQAVEYKNLTAAAQQIGLSQPQLSRIVSTLEKKLNVTLLDRSSRRNTKWTDVALKIAEIYIQSAKNLQHALTLAAVETEPSLLRIGMLEGLTGTALSICRKILQKTNIKVLELDVYDLNQLETMFLNDDLDIIFSSREPGKKKNQHIKQLGYQILDVEEKGRDYQILSLYQYRSQTQKSKRVSKLVEKTVVSNSLAVRKAWMENFGGYGVFPSAVYERRKGLKTEQEVFMVANDDLPKRWWNVIEGIV